MHKPNCKSQVRYCPAMNEFHQHSEECIGGGVCDCQPESKCCVDCNKVTGFTDCFICPCHKKEESKECKKGCLNHKYHCANCFHPLTYSPQNFASRPEDIPNPCPNPTCYPPQQEKCWDGNPKCKCGVMREVLTNKEFQEKYKDDYSKPPKEDYSHSHCWESNKPPCGQRIKHFECCLCQKLNPRIEILLQESRTALKKEIVEKIDLLARKKGYNEGREEITNLINNL